MISIQSEGEETEPRRSRDQAALQLAAVEHLRATTSKKTPSFLRASSFPMRVEGMGEAPGSHSKEKNTPQVPKSNFCLLVSSSKTDGRAVLEPTGDLGVVRRVGDGAEPNLKHYTGYLFPPSEPGHTVSFRKLNFPSKPQPWPAQSHASPSPSLLQAGPRPPPPARPPLPSRPLSAS